MGALQATDITVLTICTVVDRLYRTFHELLSHHRIRRPRMTSEIGFEFYFDLIPLGQFFRFFLFTCYHVMLYTVLAGHVSR
jgi:hypothetical protein